MSQQSSSASVSRHVIVAGYLRVDPGNQERYLQSCEPIVAAARFAEGCLDFAIGADLVEPGRINIYERWVARATLEAFRQGGPDDGQGAMIIGAEVSEFEVVGT